MNARPPPPVSPFAALAPAAGAWHSGRMHDRVAAILREAAAEAILPRFRALAAHEVEEKTPGELVTVADREAEAVIARRLAALLPGSSVIGEEAAELRPELLDRVADGAVWLVDPLDGTANFVEGSARFAVMVALLRDGAPVAAWILDPVPDRLAAAEAGAGAFLDGMRLSAPAEPPGADGLRCALMTRFLPPSLRAHVEGRLERLAEALPGYRCAGHEYLAIARGGHHGAFFWRTLPWDHAPGALLLAEAGGRAAHPDGSVYHPGARRPGLLAAQNPEAWDQTRAALLGDGAPLG